MTPTAARVWRVGIRPHAAGQSESFARFRATHHVSSDHVIDLGGDRPGALGSGSDYPPGTP